ncbi:NAD-dependent epimerase/dehydratase family protein [Kangiella marina]|uniref:SDR family oxidoreductase n=1 Tax=Kangiella marina TaxID=1079178 RepID=A0ABP8INY3_9GAMM
MAKILVTGSSGFVGTRLMTLLNREHHIIAPVRKHITMSLPNVHYPIVADLADLANQSQHFSNIDIVIHAAAKAHAAGESLDKYRQINTEATLAIAKSAAKQGVKRFVFLSSIGVNGLGNNKPFTVSDTPCPVEAYAISKFEAENELKRVASETGMEVVIIRPPLVYGAKAPGNFCKLRELTNKNLPLPLGAIYNKRSLVALDNLIDLIITCIDHSKAANQTFLVSDDQDISTTDLLKMMIIASGKKTKLLAVPVTILKVIGILTRKQTIIDRLCGNLQVDISHTKHTLNWTPPITVEEGIKRCFIKEELC